MLRGAKEIQPRWKRCVTATDRNLGEALGQLYVEKYFPPEAKAKALEMVHNLIAALHDDLQTLPWMSPETRAQATAKLTRVWREDRLPGQVARLFVAESRSRVVHAERIARRGV